MNIINKIGSFFGVTKGREHDDGRQSIVSSNKYSHDPIKTLKTKDYLEMYKGRVYTASTTIADSCVACDRKLQNDKGEDIYHEYMGLITSAFIRYVALNLELAGTCYIWKVMAGKKLLAIQGLRPDLVKPVRDTMGKVTKYEYHVGRKVIPFQPEEIIVFNAFHPLAGFPNKSHGFSTVQAAAATINLDYESEKWNASWFTESAEAGTILSTDKDIDEKMQRRLKAQWESKYKGSANAHRLALLTGGLKYESPKPAQKEMDFVNSQRWNMEKILAIFKVPKALIGMGEGVNVGNVYAFEVIFAKRKIAPLVKDIAEVITKELFDGIGTFVFENVIPVDPNEIRNNYLYGITTKNEARSKLGYKRDKNGDVYNDMSEAIIEEDASKGVRTQKSTERSQKSTDLDFSEAVQASIPGTEEYYEERANKRVKRLNKNEKSYKAALERIFHKQKMDILEQLVPTKKRGKRDNVPQLGKNYIALYISLLMKPQKDILQNEGDIAMKEVDVEGTFNLATPEMVVWQKENIAKLANSIDKVTDEKIRDVVEAGLAGGLSPAQIKDSVEPVFADLTRKRLETIVRTETIRVSSQGQQKAWEQCGVVSGKKWYTALDERTCEYCAPMHGKVISLTDNFYQKGDSFVGSNGGTIKLDYSDTKGPPLHVNCRCSLIPIVSD